MIKTVSRALASHKAAFHINLPQKANIIGWPSYCIQISPISRVRHELLDCYGSRINGSEYRESRVDTENPAVPWRAADEVADAPGDYSTAMGSWKVASQSSVRLISARFAFGMRQRDHSGNWWHCTTIWGMIAACSILRMIHASVRHGKSVGAVDLDHGPHDDGNVRVIAFK